MPIGKMVSLKYLVYYIFHIGIRITNCITLRKLNGMKQFLLVVLLILAVVSLEAQCVMCTKTASSLDDEAAKGLNGGIIYLAFMPLLLIGFIGYNWYKRNKDA